MVLRMKNFNIFGVHWKIWFLGEGSRKISIGGGGGACLKGGAWTVCQFIGGLGKKGAGVFKGGWYPNTHYVLQRAFTSRLEADKIHVKTPKDNFSKDERKVLKQ